MKQTLPSLIALFLGLAAIAASGQTPDPPRSGPPSSAPPQTAPASPPAVASPSKKPASASSSAAGETNFGADGQKLVARSAQMLFAQGAISARMRQRVDLFGHQLVGVGSFQQLAPSSERLVRMELKLQLTDQPTSMQQVCDGRFLWTRKETAKGVSLARVDLRRVQEAVDASGGVMADGGAPWLALGGLPKLVRNLETHFQFGTPQSSQLAEVPVWLVEGTWRPEMLAKLWSGEKSTAAPSLDRLPDQLPQSVQLAIGRDDLFPYRIEYRRNVKDGKGISTPQAIVTLELFEVQLGGEIDRSRFVYQPADNEVSDQTDAYLKTLGLKVADKKRPVRR